MMDPSQMGGGPPGPMGPPGAGPAGGQMMAPPMAAPPPKAKGKGKGKGHKFHGKKARHGKKGKKK